MLGSRVGALFLCSAVEKVCSVSWCFWTNEGVRLDLTLQSTIGHHWAPSGHMCTKELQNLISASMRLSFLKFESVWLGLQRIDQISDEGLHLHERIDLESVHSDYRHVISFFNVLTCVQHGTSH